MSNLPLNGLTVLEFSRWLSAPSAGLRLADLGAHVVKIEDTLQGDPCRRLVFNGLKAGEDSLLFHTINRNKESLILDLHSDAGQKVIRQLITGADVLLHNYPSEIMEAAGLGYAQVLQINPRIVYGAIGSYGTQPLPDTPGQDILIQALSGLAWTSGDDNDPPMPFGLPIADSLCGAQLVQGILAALIRRRHTGRGGLVETSLIESALDFQFELLTTYYSSGQLPRRSTVNNGHALLSAPYGIYGTTDGYIAMAMINIGQLAAAIHCDDLAAFSQEEAFSRRDEMKQVLADHLATQSSAYWLKRLHAEDLWAMEVLDWKTMTAGEAYKLLKMEQEVQVNGKKFTTTRCPIRITTPPSARTSKEANHEPVNGQRPTANDKPLHHLLVLDFSQFLSGPSASLRLADLGAQVIKIERPGTGDICRQLYVSDVKIEGESTIFHAINRNKQSYAADLKSPHDLEKIKQLIAKADVMMHNFRPGVMERIGLDYAAVKKINPRIIYGEVTGYGSEGPWKDLPGQDLLLQSVSGLAWLSNNHDRRPTPMGVAVVDILAGTHIAQGILAALYRRGATGPEQCHPERSRRAVEGACLEPVERGALVQVSMLESIIDFQFEVLTGFYNNGRRPPARSALSNGHAWLPAPYGIYKTANGFIALATGSIPLLGERLQSPALRQYTNEKDWLDKRDEVKQVIAGCLVEQTTAHWMQQLAGSGIGSAPVLDYAAMQDDPAYQALGMELKVNTSNGLVITTTRCPIRIDGQVFGPATGAPLLGEHNEAIEQQFGLKKKAASY